MKNDMLEASEIRYLQEKGIFKSQTMDGGIAPLTSPNAVLPAGILTQISTDLVRIITRKRTADLVIGTRKKVLDWEDNDALIPIIEPLGEAQPYSDFGNPPATSLNPSFAQAGHYRFSSTVQVGNLEQQQLSRAKISAQSEKMAAALETLAIEFNNIAFFGLPNLPTGAKYPVQGILNNDNLPAYQAATTTQATATFDTVYADVRDIVAEVITNSKGHVQANSKMYLIVSNAMATLNTLLNQWGKSVKEVVKENYPNLEWVYSSELDGAYTGGLNVMYLRVEDGDLANVRDSAIIGFSELALSSAVDVSANFTEQVISSGTVGTIVYRPYMFARRYFPAS